MRAPPTILNWLGLAGSALPYAEANYTVRIGKVDAAFRAAINKVTLNLICICIWSEVDLNGST